MSTTDMQAKRRRSPWMNKYLVNPMMRPIVGIFPGTYAVLETTGRRTGHTRRVPVGNGVDGDTFWLVAEHGTHCGYVQNLMAEPRVRVRIGRRWRDGTATLIEDDDPIARRRQIDSGNGFAGRLDGMIFRSNATTPMTIRIDLDPESGSLAAAGAMTAPRSKQ